MIESKHRVVHSLGFFSFKAIFLTLYLEIRLVYMSSFGENSSFIIYFFYSKFF